MAEYTVDRAKIVSFRRRYEYLRKLGVTFDTGGSHPIHLRGQELDEHIDRQLWMERHPGEHPVQKWRTPSDVPVK
jgi:hypothetical protein